MIKFILHGGFTSADNEQNRTFYAELARDIPDGGTVLLCYFASKDEDNSRRFEEDCLRVSQYANGKQFTFLLANEAAFIDQLQSSDALYLRGGSTPKLLSTLRQYPDFAAILEGKTVAGSSAGAYAMASYSAFHDDQSGGVIRQGLGLLPIRLVCHFESTVLPPNPEALKLLLDMEPQLEVVLLRDFEWKVLRV